MVSVPPEGLLQRTKSTVSDKRSVRHHCSRSRLGFPSEKRSASKSTSTTVESKPQLFGTGRFQPRWPHHVGAC